MQEVTVESLDVTLSVGGKFVGVLKAFLSPQYDTRTDFIPSELAQRTFSEQEIEELRKQLMERIGENFSGVMKIEKR